MGKRSQKYVFGLSKPIIAKRNYNISTKKATYTDAFQCGEAINVTVTPNYTQGELYGDNKKVVNANEFTDASVTLGSTTMPYSAPAVLFGHTVDEETGVEHSRSDDSPNEVGLGFVIKNYGGTYDAAILWKVSFSEGAENFQTKGSSISFVTPELSGSALAREEDNEWRTKNFGFTSEGDALAWIYEELGLTEATYTVTFNSDGGSAVADQEVAAGQKATEPAVPEKTGYTFSGWYTNAECTAAYDFDSPVTGDITLYAKWVEE